MNNDIIAVSPMEIKVLRENWCYVSHLLKPAFSFEEHQRHLILLDVLSDETEESESLSSLIDIINLLIKDYNEKQ
jgi:hypothetical protein